MQAKRISVVSNSGGVGTQQSNTVTMPTTPREQINAHNIHLSMGIEPESAGANANGTWALLCLEDVGKGIPAISPALLTTETENFSIIAMGVWVASNEGPFNKQVDIKSSRTCLPGTRIVLAIRRDGVSAGNVRIISSVFFHTVRK